MTKKGFRPLCIPKQPNDTSRIDAGAEAAQSHPKEKKEKQQEKKCRQRRMNENEGASRPLRPPQISHQAPRLRSTGTNQHLQKGPRRRQRCCQGFPPVHDEARGRIAPDALQEGPAAPTDVAASVSDRPTGVSTDPNLHLGCSRACHQTIHHPAPTRSRGPHAVSPRHSKVRIAW